MPPTRRGAAAAFGASSADGDPHADLDGLGRSSSQLSLEEVGSPRSFRTISPVYSGKGSEEGAVDRLRRENAALRAHLSALKAKNAALVRANAGLRRTTTKTLSPALFSIQGENSVRCSRLGRSASISTKDELRRLDRDRKEVSYDSDAGSSVASMAARSSFAERMEGIFRLFSADLVDPYLSSAQFANEVIELCGKVAQVFKGESRVLELCSPLYVFGDLHGNVEDLQAFASVLWPLGMRLTAGTFLFLGDYVDRGQFGLELVALLFSQKITMPDKIYLLRGNHETRAVNGWEEFYRQGSFLFQCKARFGVVKGTEVWEACNHAFDHLPLACVIDGSIFSVHGGIPCPTAKKGDKDQRLRDIRALPCPIDIQLPEQPAPGEEETKEQKANRLAFSLLWADPADTKQEGVLGKTEHGFGDSARGGGAVVFSSKAVHEFLDRYKYDYIMRAHEATANGVNVCKDAKVLTVFSTSKDHGWVDAKCGCILVDKNKIQAINRDSSCFTNVDNDLWQLSSIEEESV